MHSDNKKPGFANRVKNLIWINLWKDLKTVTQI